MPVLSSSLINLVKNKDIDWYGVCNFDSNGRIESYKKPNSPNNKSWLKPIPKNESILNEATECLKSLEMYMQPATQLEITACMKRLSLHCGMQNKAPAEVASLLLDYIHDLSKYSLTLIETACAKYRQLPEGNRFMPGSGQLIALMVEEEKKMQLIRSRLEKILGLGGRQKKETGMVSLTEVLENL